MIKVSVVIPARNEEKYLAKTLQHLQRQTLKPNEVIVINDNSKDKTRQIAKAFNCKIVDYLIEHENWTESPNLAIIKNLGFKTLIDNYDYVMVLGSDHLLPPNYIQTLTERMEETKDLVVSAGLIEGEWSTVPRGSGRMIKKSFFKQINSKYPVNYGYEGYMLYKAQSLGYKIKQFNDLVTQTQRKTSSNYSEKAFNDRGKSMRALGYSSIYTLGRCFVMMKRHGFKAGIEMRKGYKSKNIPLYEKDLRQYVNETHQFGLHHIKSFFHFAIFIMKL